MLQHQALVQLLNNNSIPDLLHLMFHLDLESWSNICPTVYVRNYSNQHDNLGM